MVDWLGSEIEELNRLIQGKQGEIATLEQKRHHLQQVLVHCVEKRIDEGRPPISDYVEMVLDAEDLRDALLRIAHQDGGILDTVYARSVLVAAGMIDDARPGYKRVWRAVGTLERNAGKLERIERGRYRLIS